MSITWSHTSEVTSSFNRWKIAEYQYNIALIREHQLPKRCTSVYGWVFWVVSCKVLIYYWRSVRKLHQHFTETMSSTLIHKTLVEKIWISPTDKPHFEATLISLVLQPFWNNIGTICAKPFWNSIGIFSLQVFRWNNADTTNSQTFCFNTSKIFL